MTANHRVRVLIVDDSAAMRQTLTQILSSDPGLEVVGTASDPIFAREKILRLNPDVLTLDIEMPRMDGLTFLGKLMAGHPMPVVMISSLTQRGAEATLRALEIGAVDFVPKPTMDVVSGIFAGAHEIIHAVKAASAARIAVLDKSLSRRDAAHVAPSQPGPRLSGIRPLEGLIAIGASTGGTEAIRMILSGLPADSPGIVIAQHMPAGFTASFANRLNGLSALSVREAKDGDLVERGVALIAPGGLQTAVCRSGGRFTVRVFEGEPVNHHRPSVDVLFESCAEQVGGQVIAAILTGMGTDGARGLRKIRDAGGRTIGQDEATCVVYGMPRAAFVMGGVETVLPLERIGPSLIAA